MSGIAEALNPFVDGVFGSTRWLRVVNLLCLAGAATALLSLLGHGRVVAARLRGDGAVAPGPFATGLSKRLTLGLLALAIGAGVYQVWLRYVEVNHFPSQTMSEVVVMFSLSLLVALAVLHFALRLTELGPGWAMLDDALLIAVLLCTIGVNYYTTTLSTAQRDLPPALQSYWFPPHLIALIFSYATLGIGALLCVKYFAIRFWTVLLTPGGARRAWSQALILALFLALPYIQVVTIPILLGVGLVLLVGRAISRLPGPERLAQLEAQWDHVSYRAFCVGIPFLTAGLFMGAFWAQEAWANYWGWDSKENSALITWLVYVLYIHLRMLGGYRGEKAMAVLAAGAASVFLTFQLFGYLPDSQKSLHRYTDDNVVPREGMQGAKSVDDTSARLEQR